GTVGRIRRSVALADVVEHAGEPERAAGQRAGDPLGEPVGGAGSPAGYGTAVAVRLSLVVERCGGSLERPVRGPGLVGPMARGRASAHAILVWVPAGAGWRCGLAEPLGAAAVDA